MTTPARAGRTSPTRGKRSPAAILALLVVLGALLAGCGGGGDSAGGDSAMPASGSVAQRDEAGGGGDTAVHPDEEAFDSADGDAARVVLGIRAEIRTANTTVRVKNVRAAATRAQDATESLGGVVAGAEIHNAAQDPEGEASARLTLRVPNDDLTDFLRTLAALGEELETTESTQDVSGEVADVESRIANQEASIAQLRRFMKRATQIEDVLRVEAELTRRQADLEALQARQRVLADRTALATVRATFVATPDASSAVHDDDLGFLTGLRNGWEGLVSVALVTATVLGALLPFVVVLVLLGVPAVLLWRLRARGRVRPAATPE